MYKVVLKSINKTIYCYSKEQLKKVMKKYNNLCNTKDIVGDIYLFIKYNDKYEFFGII